MHQNRGGSAQMIRRMVRLEQKFLNERFWDVIPGKRVRHERRQIVEIAWVDEVDNGRSRCESGWP